MTAPAKQIKRMKRELNGVLLLNKDLGLSSNRALQQVKYFFQAAKAGHTGSLDPLATGVLPICFGEATKFSSYLLDADKTYRVTAKLGVVTSTSDREGEVIATYPVPNFTTAQILEAVAGFIGASKQIPSMYSALKHNGQPLYKLARQGVKIDRPARDIFVYEYILLSQSADLLTFEIKCSKGTYIRNLIEDLGAKLGCGAHVHDLQRTLAGKFAIQDAVTLEQLLQHPAPDTLILPVISLLDQLPQVRLSQIDSEHLRHGRAVRAMDLQQAGDCALISDTEVFLGVGQVLPDGILVPSRMASFRAEA